MSSFRDELQEIIKEDKPERLLFLAIDRAYYHPRCQKIMPVLEEIPGLCQVQFSEEISTAAISFSAGQFSLFFNKKFLEKYVFTPDCLLFVVLHELFHKINGDIFIKLLADTGRQDPNLANIAFDLFINQKICRELLESPAEILERLYSNGQILVQVLIPPYFFAKDILKISEFEKLSPDKKIVLIQEKLIAPIKTKEAEIKKLVIELYRQAWLGTSSVSGLYSLLSEIKRKLSGEPEEKLLVIDLLLGDHTGPSNSWDEWIKKYLGSFWRPDGDETSYTRTIVVEPRKAVRFFNLVRAALAPNIKHPVLKEMLLPEFGFFPFPGRKEAFLMSAGWIPLYYPNPVIKKELDEWRTFVYVDVSGSTGKWWEVIYGLILATKDIIGSPVFGFSEKVFPLEITDIKEGKVKTTYGTDINCVLRHSLDNHFKKVLIITDGESGRMDGKLLNMFRKEVDPYIILTGKLAKFSWGVQIIEQLTGPGKKGKKWWSLSEIR